MDSSHFAYGWRRSPITEGRLILKLNAYSNTRFEAANIDAMVKRNGLIKVIHKKIYKDALANGVIDSRF